MKGGSVHGRGFYCRVSMPHLMGMEVNMAMEVGHITGKKKRRCGDLVKLWWESIERFTEPTKLFGFGKSSNQSAEDGQAEIRIVSGSSMNVSGPHWFVML